MPESTSSQCSTPTPYNGSTSSNGSDNQWVQVESLKPETEQNGTALQWRELPLHSISPPVSTNNMPSGHTTNQNFNLNGLNQQIPHNQPNYINIPYQRSAVPNGYTAVNVPRGINGQVVNMPNIIRAPNGQIINSWPNQQALGRYVAQAPTWTSNKTSGGVKKQKRIRTAFTSQQMMELEQEYARTRYLDRARRIELADILRLNERTIKIWFQNRRMKEKKDRAESLEDSEEASGTSESPEVGHIQVPMLIHEQYPGPNEVYNQGIYIEQYPVSAPMPVNNMQQSPTMSQVPVPVQEMYNLPEYVTEEQCRPYKQVHFQVQHYPTYSSEIQQLPSEPVPQSEAVTSTNAPSDIIEKSWDLSWIRSLQGEEEY